MIILILEIVGWVIAAIGAGTVVYFVMSLATHILRVRARELATAREAFERRYGAKAPRLTTGARRD